MLEHLLTKTPRIVPPQELATKRYPGIRPFQDTELDRKLFHGRSEEAESLFHLILAERLIVLYAKSGVGKTSLLNAGVFNKLQRDHFFPIQVRLNDTTMSCIEKVYLSLFHATKDRNVDVTYRSNSGGELDDRSNLLQFFREAEFWSDDDILLTPILVFDQFEEIFTLDHKDEIRTFFFEQLADLIRGYVPAVRRAQFNDNGAESDDSSYSSAASDVKVVLSLREDFLANLEELSIEIPSILTNRFRLKGLTPEQAGDAIEVPAQFEDTAISTRTFRYEPGAVKALVDFLMKRSQSNQRHTATKKEIEPFQLQVICQHVEDAIVAKKKNGQSDMVVTEKDLGGESGMQKILQRFYDTQVQRISKKYRRRVKKLCEKKLISPSGRRLSLDEEIITKKHRIPRKVLDALVNYRLIRAEPRLDGLSYEISHDTLVKPILASAKKRQENRMPFLLILGVVLLLLSGFFYESITASNRFEEIDELLEDIREFIDSETKKLGSQSGDPLPSSLTLQEKIDSLYAFDRDLHRFTGSWRTLSGRGNDHSNLDDETAIDKIISESINTLRAIGDLNRVSLHMQGGSHISGIAQYQVPETIRAEVTIDTLESQNFLWLYWIDSKKRVLATEKIQPEKSIYEHPYITEVVPGEYDVRVYLDRKKELILISRESFSVKRKSEDYYRNNISQNPDDALSLANLGYILLEKGKPDSALIMLNQAIEIDDSFSKVYFWRGQAYLQRNDFARAENDYIEAIRRQPENRTYWDDLLSYYGQGNMEINNLVKNFSFESPPINTWLLINEIDGWHAPSKISFDIKDSYSGLAANGRQFVELDGRLPSSIQTTLHTVPGQSYRLIFAYSARPRLDSNQVEVRWNKEMIKTFDTDGSGRNNIQWEIQIIDVHAKSDTSILEFIDKSTDTDGMGGYLDAVYVIPESAISDYRTGFALKQIGAFADAREKFLSAIHQNPKYEAAYDALWTLFKEKPKNLIQNFSFEEQSLTKSASIFANTTDHWLAPSKKNFSIKRRIQLKNEAAEGEQFVALDGSEKTSIRTRIFTEEDKKYILSFSYSPVPKKEENKLEVIWGEAVLTTLYANGESMREGDTIWQKYHFLVEGRNEQTVLEFVDRSESEDAAGGYIDAVYLLELPNVN